ncbi:MAG TPA: hypothetical protein DCM86_03130 [Verrucomicrobiales bacterium]|nr:hypothetical protein [Verrucomicrobiales bacterium]
MSTFVRVFVILALGWRILAPFSTSGASLPSGFAETQVVTGLTSPTAMAFTPDGRLFIAQQSGEIRILKSGLLLPDPFVVVPTAALAERGLVGIAIDPGFSSNGLVYVNYTVPVTPPHNVIARYASDPANPDLAIPGSEEILFTLENQNATVHVGGGINFGPGGKLYIGHGESGSGSAPQETTSLYGKLLRINPDGSIPWDNPFYNTATNRNRAIYALGLRNPFTFAFDPVSGHLYVNDVGAHVWEEVDDILPGGNYGWPTAEGPSGGAFLDPIYTYQHGDGILLGYSVTGGTFYRPPVDNFPAAYVGHYFCADYVNGWINVLNPATHVVDNFRGVELQLGIVDLDVGPDGGLYMLARGTTPSAGSGVGYSTGVIRRIDYTGSLSPTITVPPTSQTVAVGSAATFSITASGTPPLSYQWQRAGVDLPGATGTSYTTPATVLADNGALFQCRVANPYGSVTSPPADLTVATNQPPVPTITLPAPGSLYVAGTSVAFAGTATDPEDGPLGPGAFSWRIDLHHDTHTHPGMPVTVGITNGTYPIPANIEVSDNVWYRIYLFVTDSQGATTVTYREILPTKQTFQIQTQPPGLPLLLDSQPVPGSLTVTGVVGVVRTLGTPLLVTNAGKAYQFDSWSDGGAAVHSITTQPVPTTYTATFHVLANTPPLADILAPVEDTTYSAGETLLFYGRGVDAEDGLLPPSAFAWRVDFYHGGQVDYAFPIQGGITNGQLHLETAVDPDPNAFYRINLAVTDSSSRVGTAIRDILPNRQTFLLKTAPEGLSALLLDGAAVPSGISVTGVVGVTRSLGVATSVTNAGQVYDFTGWSDGGAASHTIPTPLVPTTYTASFQPRVVATNTPPQLTLLSPAAGSLYSAGDLLLLAGSATDTQDGTLPPGACSWSVEFHHTGVTDLFLPATPGLLSTSLPLPRVVDPDPTAFYRVVFSATDASNATSIVSRDLAPNLQAFTLATAPAGLPGLRIDSGPLTSGITVTGVVGVTRTLAALNLVTNGGKRYQFTGWSDGGALTHPINTPAAATTFTAAYAEVVNTPPVAEIVTPTTGTQYRAGDTLLFEGRGTDPQDGSLGPGAFAWRIDFHHSGKVDYAMRIRGGITNGSLALPVDVDPDPNAFYRIQLAVTDSASLVGTTYRDVLPVQSSFTLSTLPPGLPAVLLDSAAAQLDVPYPGVVGIARSLDVVTRLTNAAGRVYQFKSWSDGGAAAHAIAVPSAPTTFTARFEEVILNTPPTVALLAPPPGSAYTAGQPLHLAAEATDAQDGVLPGSAFHWTLEFHHSGMADLVDPGAGGSATADYLIPTEVDPDPEAFYRVLLTVVDSGGLSTNVTRDVQPLRGGFTLATDPPGLPLLLDGALIATPTSVTGVVGVARSIGVVSPYVQPTNTFEFAGWSDGGTATHTLQTPGAGSTLTARFYWYAGLGPTPSLVTLVPQGSIWRYLDLGPDPGPGWMKPGFDDAAWLSGPAELGYGDGDEATVMRFGPDPAAKPITSYFRRAFPVSLAMTLTNLELRLLRDDGAVVYLNGTEVLRSNMPEGVISPETTAASLVTGADEKVFHPSTLDPALLVEGTNLLAVELHQVSANTPDASFDLELVGWTDHRPALTLRVAPGTGHILVAFRSVGGVGYTLYGSDDMIQWRELATLAGNGGDAAFEIDPSGVNATAFFRVRISP